MLPEKSKVFFRSDYIKPNYLVHSIDIGFDLDSRCTKVSSKMVLKQREERYKSDLILFGEDLELVFILMNGKRLLEKDFKIIDGNLIISNCSKLVILEIQTLVYPKKNTSLMGLYVSGENLVTQCEAEGFRKITFFPDRPDILSKFRVMLRASKKDYPILLSNGNLTEKGNLDDGRHYALWEDPFKKPSYLFALVAGKLVTNERKIKLKSGKNALLQVWVEKSNFDKTDFAMESLIKSIRWDEERFNLELDLERYMIVAVNDFNMGAMENKGLNIFNSKFVLANPRISTDQDYANIKSVIAHEYFHNWTGNRVTCRDWFQLSLKEGLTVFRDQEFSADMMKTTNGLAIKRIQDVNNLRENQFPEDAGQMSHPVRPDKYSEINNFYTATIYEKGAEVVRMLQTLFGKEGFLKGINLYFERHDGEAVTCSDFLDAMASANDKDLKQFELWYSQSGTPNIIVKSYYDDVENKYDLFFEQNNNITSDQKEKKPLHIPIMIGLIDSNGKDMGLQLETSKTHEDIEIKEIPTNLVLELKEKKQLFSFKQIYEKPVPSIMRNFSAPVIIDYNYSDEDLAFLTINDSDIFNRWEAAQNLITRCIFNLINQKVDNESKFFPKKSDHLIINIFKKIIHEKKLDPILKSLILNIPTEKNLSKKIDIIDPKLIYFSKKNLSIYIANTLKEDFLSSYFSLEEKDSYNPDIYNSGKRSLRNVNLNYLSEINNSEIEKIILNQFNQGNNMTDRLAALKIIVNKRITGVEKILNSFIKEFHDEHLVIDKWFTIQAEAPSTNLELIKKLMNHRLFNLRNPNRYRSLIFAFCNNNPLNFHDKSGQGYFFWADQVINLDKVNSQIASRLARVMDNWKKYTPKLRKNMELALLKVSKNKNISKDVSEIVIRALQK
tara:strand:- start:70 stop:2754 length:2685 start_codon:yes stop_codon:yes gene_type:complete